MAGLNNTPPHAETEHIDSPRAMSTNSEEFLPQQIDPQSGRHYETQTAQRRVTTREHIVDGITVLESPQDCNAAATAAQFLEKMNRLFKRGDQMVRFDELLPPAEHNTEEALACLDMVLSEFN